MWGHLALRCGPLVTMLLDGTPHSMPAHAPALVLFFPMNVELSVLLLVTREREWGWTGANSELDCRLGLPLWCQCTSSVLSVKQREGPGGRWPHKGPRGNEPREALAKRSWESETLGWTAHEELNPANNHEKQLSCVTSSGAVGCQWHQSILFTREKGLHHIPSGFLFMDTMKK